VLVSAAHGHGRIRGPEGQHGPIARLRRFGAEWASRLETLRSTRQSAVALAFAIGTKLAEGAGILAVQQAFGIHLSIGATSLVLAAVVLGSMVPVAPGNVGRTKRRRSGVPPSRDRAEHGDNACDCRPSVFSDPLRGVGYVVGSVKHSGYPLRNRASTDAAISGQSNCWARVNR